MNHTDDSALELELTVCPLCASSRWRPILRAPDYLWQVPGVFQLVCCRVCGHVFQNPRPKLESIQACYPKHYSDHVLSDAGAASPRHTADSDVESERRRPWYLSPVVRVIPGLRQLYCWLNEDRSRVIPQLDLPSKRALDVGCASGKFLAQLSEQDWDVQGVELSSSQVSLARQHGFDIHEGTLESAAFPGAYFDAVFLWGVISHVLEPKLTLAEIHRILKPSGFLVLSTPNYACWESFLFGRCWYAMQLPTHLHYFTPMSLRSLLRTTGYESIEIIHQRHMLNVIGSIGIWLRELFPSCRIAQRLVDYPAHPRLWVQLALAPLAKFLALIHQGGRLTVIARRSE